MDQFTTIIKAPEYPLQLKHKVIFESFDQLASFTSSLSHFGYGEEDGGPISLDNWDLQIKSFTNKNPIDAVGPGAAEMSDLTFFP